MNIACFLKHHTSICTEAYRLFLCYPRRVFATPEKPYNTDSIVINGTYNQLVQIPPAVVTIMNFYLISVFAAGATATYHHMGSSVAVGMPTTAVVQPMVTPMVTSPLVPTLRAVPVTNVMSPFVSHTPVLPSMTSSYVTDVLPTTHYLRGPTTIGTYGHYNHY
eukprot:Protomagalhaensia_sp_Gyna_25__893@NODE_142_length_4920_cov_484_660930_g112_i0_p4_GENE_NODE_142_length_4920_cov_484_660930_g112_i0NODE_142_length_4920_cov_484_660930_g112_i0_p4_ORF_typecomplete_len163_score4_91_NODE_142_length_4920_cov_484_660930_g112_i034243912